MTEQVQAFWTRFLQETGRPADTQMKDCYYFDTTESLANELLALVLSGQKRATASPFPSYEAEGDPVPKIGDLSVLTDFAGTPHCVIETRVVTILPFREMTYDIVKREGEDDTLESWQKGHIRFFTEDAEALGYTFDWDMPVVFEDFEVVYTP